MRLSDSLLKLAKQFFRHNLQTLSFQSAAIRAPVIAFVLAVAVSGQIRNPTTVNDLVVNLIDRSGSTRIDSGMNGDSRMVFEPTPEQQILVVVVEVTDNLEVSDTLQLAQQDQDDDKHATDDERHGEKENDSVDYYIQEVEKVGQQCELTVFFWSSPLRVDRFRRLF